MSSGDADGLAARPRAFLGVHRSFDHYVRLVQRFLDVPVALVSIVEHDRQVFPGADGLPSDYQVRRQTPLSHSFCQYVVADQQPLVVADARTDPRLVDNLAITDLNVIAYAGWPLVDSDGHTIGSLCAIDHEPRQWRPTELEALKDLAEACSAELRTTLELARSSQHLTQAVFESVDVAIAMYSTSGKLLVANALAHRAARASGFELDAAPFGGPHVRRADNRTPVPVDEQIVPRALRDELHDHEMEWIGRPGSEIAVTASARPVHGADGVRVGTVIAAHDVTALARALEVKDAFVATVSHELRTPLTSILGYAELLADEIEVGNGMAGRALETIQRAGQNLQIRIADLLDTADQRRALELEPTDVVALLSRPVATLLERASAAELTLVLDVGGHPRGSQWAVLDPLRVEQAVENLISNSLKYTPSGGTVSVGLESFEDQVHIVVADDGVGMSADEISRAFDSFWRADAARRDAVQGVGLGLTLVRDIVRAHHGTVTIDSDPGRGTRVTMRLPRSAIRSI